MSLTAAAARRQNRIHGGGGRQRYTDRRRGSPGLGEMRGGQEGNTRYPEILLTPGALETIVMNNGAYVTTSRGRRATGREEGARSGGGGQGQGRSENVSGGSGSGSSTTHDTDYMEKVDLRRLQSTAHR